MTTSFIKYIIAFLLLFEILFKSDKMHSKYKIMAYIFWIQQNVLSKYYHLTKQQAVLNVAFCEYLCFFVIMDTEHNPKSGHTKW